MAFFSKSAAARAGQELSVRGSFTGHPGRPGSANGASAVLSSHIGGPICFSLEGGPSDITEEDFGNLLKSTLETDNSPQ